MDLLMMTDGNKSHYVYVKILTIRQNAGLKTLFKYCLQCLSGDRKTFLEINVKQTAKLKDDLIKFKHYFKRLAVPFEIYADF